MIDFIMSALPFVIIGVCIAVIVVGYKGKKEENYLLEGMCFGMCLGITLSTALKLDMGMGVSLGMLIGEAVGIFIKKK